MYVILVYDIVLDTEGPKILRKVFKSCKKYLTHIQNSVFEGELSEGQLYQLQAELQKYLRKEVDSCIIFKSRNTRWMQKEFWAKVDDAGTTFL